MATMYKKNNIRPSQKERLRDLCVVIACVLFAAAITIFVKPTFLTSTILFFGLPSAYLIWRKPSSLYKAALAAFLLGVVWGFAFDYVAEINFAWGWSTNTNLAIPFHLFEVVSFDILIWYFLWVLLSVLFYEYFAEYDFSKKVSRAYPYAIAVGLIVSCLVVLVHKLNPAILTFKYAYLTIGTATLIPFAFILIKRPRIIPKVMEIIPFFIFLYLAFELAALHAELWSFPGEYIGSVNILGLIFPFEEFFFWIIISSAVTAAYHEFVVDDGK